MEDKKKEYLRSKTKKVSVIAKPSNSVADSTREQSKFSKLDQQNTIQVEDIRDDEENHEPPELNMEKVQRFNGN